MKVLLIYNKESGRGKITKDLPRIIKILEEENYTCDTYSITIERGVCKNTFDILDLYDVLLIAGGDGTINTVINSVMKIDLNKRPKLLFLPYGTTNDTSTMLGLKRKIKDNLNLLKTDSFYKMDVYQANDSYFLYASALGKMTKTSYDIDRRFLKNMGVLGYFINGLKDLFTNYNINVRLINGKEELNTQAFLILLVGSNRLAGFNLNKFSNTQKLNSGIIGVRVFSYKNRLSWLRLIWFYLTGGKKNKKDFHLETESLEILIDQDLNWNLDGEKGPLGNLKLSVLKESVTVYVNPKNATKLF